ncbi:MAG: hypothetical protein LBC56_05605 [Oscillospiraceae bacterium]|jgi:hypothetical protein|nr:hypothetical protein [Oscillospiraceae bacterium]
MYRNLANLITQKGTPFKDFAALMGFNEKTLRNKISQLTEFNFSEVKKIKTVFPEYDLFYLMASDEDTLKTTEDYADALEVQAS